MSTDPTLEALRAAIARPSRPLPEPTQARPGSEEKIRVLAERVARGQELFHPMDARDSPRKE